MSDTTPRNEPEGEREQWERPELVGHGLLSEITMGGGAGLDDFLGDSGTAAPS